MKPNTMDKEYLADLKNALEKKYFEVTINLHA